MKPGTFLLLALFVGLGVGGLFVATDGFRVATTEGYRRLLIAQHPQIVPDVSLIDQNGRESKLSEYRGKFVLVEFIYTRCPSSCGLSSEGFELLKEKLKKDYINRSVALLSISFDLNHDTPNVLSAYSAHFNILPPDWRLVVPKDNAELEKLRDAFGLVVIPDGRGGLIHNTVVYLMDKQLRIVQVFDQETPADEILSNVRSHLS